MNAAEVARRLKPGAKRACLAMTAEWQFAGKRTFNANGAWALHWQRTGLGRGAIAEMENQKDGKWMRSAYRLTPLGLEVQQFLKSTPAPAEPSTAPGTGEPMGDVMPIASPSSRAKVSPDKEDER